MSQDESPTKDCNTVIVPVRIVGDSPRLNIEEHSEVYYPTVSITHTIIPEPELAEPKTETPVPLSETVEKLDETPKPKRNILKTILSMFGTFITAAAATIAVVFVGVKIVGIKTFTVLSGSMEPDYPVGSMIYVRPKDYKELKVGDVISYVANNEKTIVTHRIVDIVVDEKDPEILRFKTKGDANSSADANLVHYKNVIGTPTVAIPYLGYFAHSIQQPPGIYIALVVGTLLLAWAFLPGTLEERRKTARKSIAN